MDKDEVEKFYNDLVEHIESLGDYTEFFKKNGTDFKTFIGIV